MKKLISILGIVIVSAGLSACNTMKGVGKDVERGGEKIQSGASSTQKGSSTSGSSTGTTTTTTPPASTSPSTAPK
ncbi:entericidin, EcnA/B family [Noviherbaspirillum cavernae]|uniref:Entericidin, EcnA/B family n=1 Tax=Noviherbaspirillum cavernae TaxID=2320862 RepID=A0A418X6D9_9BURK|nr:entericidin A/B family lipoprotein [Noviherbaspirillum cavernae]RJG08028.1 entericidin, EcnA/B family [Noviherbaspirillum cavernae]